MNIDKRICFGHCIQHETEEHVKENMETFH